MGSNSRRLLNQSTHSTVARSMVSNDRHGPRRCEQCPGLGDRDFHQRFGGGVIRCFAAGQEKAERASLIVRAGVDLARKAAA